MRSSGRRYRPFRDGTYRRPFGRAYVPTTGCRIWVFLLAEQFHFSGVFATITAGLILGNWGPLGALSDQGREAVRSFWEYAAFVANSLVFH